MEAAPSEDEAMTEATMQVPPTLDDLRARREEFLAIAERHKAYNVRVFGSAVVALLAALPPEADYE
jgi:hypothetical protein